ncbi:hypothetical protein NDU88_007352 [Pleurodeles waltl]|uniref:Uncharacterized protein n=1 Tax=Pleurodeles waltl TaxID=8319 RepID=A0AAV7NSU8_PLEWA|nr:hypothetical protein NDU88_007352 [Pleurodeles waltl]
MEYAAAQGDTNDTQLQSGQIRYAELLEHIRVLDYRSYNQMVHMEADKPGIVLAKLIRPQQSPTPIPSINSSHMGIVETQIGINDVFRQYYATLYAASLPVELATIHLFLHHHTLPQVGVAEREALRTPIASAKIREALRELIHNKTL